MRKVITLLLASVFLFGLTVVASAKGGNRGRGSGFGRAVRFRQNGWHRDRFRSDQRRARRWDRVTDRRGFRSGRPFRFARGDNFGHRRSGLAQHQAAERRDLFRHQQAERRFARLRDSDRRDLARHQRAERRQLREHQRQERRGRRL